MLNPKQIKYKKKFKGVLKGKTFKGSKITFGNYAIKAIEEGRITSRQIESARKIIVKKMKKLGFLWIRIFPDIPITSKPTEVRMGKGKGAVSFWVSKVKKGQILFEVSGIDFNTAKKALKSGSNKLPILTKFTIKGL